MDDKKKKYAIPEAEVVNFRNEDIITDSLTREDEDPGFSTGETW